MSRLRQKSFERPMPHTARNRFIDPIREDSAENHSSLFNYKEMRRDRAKTEEFRSSSPGVSSSGIDYSSRAKSRDDHRTNLPAISKFEVNSDSKRPKAFLLRPKRRGQKLSSKSPQKDEHSFEKGTRSKYRHLQEIKASQHSLNRLEEENMQLQKKLLILMDEHRKYRECIDIYNKSENQDTCCIPPSILEAPLILSLRSQILTLTSSISTLSSNTLTLLSTSTEDWKNRRIKIEIEELKGKNIGLNILYYQRIGVGVERVEEREVEVLEREGEKLYKEYEALRDKIFLEEGKLFESCTKITSLPKIKAKKLLEIEELRAKCAEADAELTKIKEELGIATTDLDKDEALISELISNYSSKTQFIRNSLEFEQKDRSAKQERLAHLNATLRELESSKAENDVESRNHITKRKEEIKGLEKELDNILEVINNRRLRRIKRKQREAKTILALSCLQGVGLSGLLPSAPLQLKFVKQLSQGIDAFQSSALGSTPLIDPEWPKPAPSPQKSIDYKFKVTFDDVKTIGEDISIKLQYEKFPVSAVQTMLEAAADDSDQISITALMKFLKERPFCVKEEEKLELVARYLVEDNRSHKVAYNPRLKANLSVVKSILRVLLKSYEILTREKEEEHTAKIIEIISANYERYAVCLSILKSKVGDYCTRGQFVSMLKSAESELELHEINYIFIKFYEASKDATKLPFNELFRIFGILPPKQRVESSDT